MGNAILTGQAGLSGGVLPRQLLGEIQTSTFQVRDQFRGRIGSRASSEFSLTKGLTTAVTGYDPANPAHFLIGLRFKTTEYQFVVEHRLGYDTKSSYGGQIEVGLLVPSSATGNARKWCDVEYVVVDNRDESWSESAGEIYLDCRTGGAQSTIENILAYEFSRETESVDFRSFSIAFEVTLYYVVNANIITPQ